MHVPVSPPGACGILAVFDPESPVSGAEVLDAIGCISYRGGSNLGAGFSYFEDTDRVTLQAFASSMRALHRARGFIPRHWEIEFERALHLRGGVSG
ncbi:hypothetical protein [Thermogymnomonas acidicola]|uniref:hypothetical protein n=1 Tax=Thermogymnomonas acidicola TaxID=399579 RepID=UPI0013967F62|nr:hypothetical protein [Thermogymnomonas acidicola]